MGAEADDTVRLRRSRRSGPARRVLPWVAGTVLVAGLAGGGAWWALRQAAPPPAPPQAAPVAAAPVAAAPSPWRPPLASEAEILANQPEQTAVFRFALQPSVVVMQFPSLGEQARTLNRVAALLEKESFPHDRVLPWAELDSRIVASGGTPDTFYYGHDYRAADLVRFLSLAPDLDSQEQKLRGMVDALGWTERGAVGALITLVRAGAAPDLDAAARATILRHELSHGVYFTDPAYADWCRKFWSDVLTADERAKFAAFLAREDYDTNLSDLVVNETQAYLMHTPDPRFFSAAAVGLPVSRVEELRRLFVAGMPPGWLRDADEAATPR